MGSAIYSTCWKDLPTAILGDQSNRGISAIQCPLEFTRIYELQKSSGLHWVTNTAMACVGAILVIFLCQKMLCLLLRWRRCKGNHSVASYCASRCMATYRRVAHRIDKIWKRQNRDITMKRQLFRLWYLYSIFRYLTLFIYRFLSFIRVSVVHLLMSGDAEVNPKPQGG